MAPDVSQQASDGEAAEPATVLTHRERTKEDFQKILLDQYVNRDLIHAAAIIDSQNSRERKYAQIKFKEEDFKKVKHQYRQ